VWEAIRNRETKGDVATQSVAAILNFLKSRRRPPTVRESTWGHYVSLVGSLTEADMIQLIERFEWAVAAPPPSDLDDFVIDELLDSQRAQSHEDATRKYEHLFVYVFQQLKDKGRAPLTRTSLERELGDFGPDDEEARLQAEFRSLRAHMSQRLGEIEQRIDRGFSKLGLGFAGVHSRLDEIATSLKPTQSPELPKPTADIRRILGNASTALLSWPQETDGHWIERPQLHELHELVASDRPTFAALAGPPGSGKSALLARLGGVLLEHGVALLALKADSLPRDIASLTDLEKSLGLGASITACLTVLAKERRTVLLIDQLDALGELMDQHTSRLSVVLSLVRAIRDIPNLHIIVSCREFELRHDTRLAGLGGEQIRLDPYPWPRVKELLELKGLSADGWPQDAKDVLCVAQNLRMFVHHFAESDSVFEKYHSMLEALWDKVGLELGRPALVACERIAAAIAETEELWLPIAEFDEIRSDLDRLIARGILVKQANGRKVGFSHQTLFEFVRARMFTRGERSLAQYVLKRQDALFVRPIMWNALQYLRTADKDTYEKELQKLWGAKSLRHHVKDLLISFIGQVKSPLPSEVRWVVALLDDTSFRGRVLRSIESNPSWFRVITCRLPILMTESETTSWTCVGVLRSALDFDKDTAILLIEEHWLPSGEFDNQILSVFRESNSWSERMVSLVEQIIKRRPVSRWWVQATADSVSKSCPQLAPRIIAAQLFADLDRAPQEPVEEPSPLSEPISEVAKAFHDLAVRDAQLKPYKSIICDYEGWYGVSRIAAEAPAEFLDEVWPVFVKVCGILAVEMGRPTLYRETPAMELDDDYTHADHELPILSAFRLALQKVAEETPDRFRLIVAENEDADLMAIHCCLARGFEAAPETLAADILNYLVGDPRRLALGVRGNHTRTTALIRSAARYWLPEEALRLEEAIANWDMYSSGETDNVEERKDKRRWNREHRLILWRAFPRDRLSPSGLRHRMEEERALPGTEDSDLSVTGGWVGSPVSSTQMERARDRDILRIFGKLEDATQWDHPKDFLRGGSIQASQEFAQLAERQPRRVLRLIRHFEPAKQERPAGAALEVLARKKKVVPETVVRAVHELDARGFTSDDFRHSAAIALQEVARQRGGLSEESCSLLRSWLRSADSDLDESEVSSDAHAQRHSLLWGQMSVDAPAGNYQYLVGLTYGYLFRKPPAYDEWLSVLERHAKLIELTKVWRSLATLHLKWLWGVTERSRSIAFLDHLFESHPRVLCSRGGARLLAGCHTWLPEEKLHEWMSVWIDRLWEEGPQAAGELGMIRRVVFPGDEWCRSLVDAAIPGHGHSMKVVAGLRAGIAHSATHLWANPKYRSTSGTVIRQLIRIADEDLAQILSWVLSTSKDCPVDGETERMLSALASNPVVVASLGRGTLPDRLNEYLSAGVDPKAIADFALSLVGSAGTEIGNIQSAWASASRPLIDLSLTLQRLPDTRSQGLTIFERLLESGAYEAEKILREDIDRRL
jgi:hypothetical protein